MSSLFNQQVEVEKKTNNSSTIIVITVLCLLVIVIGGFSAKTGKWFRNEKNSNQPEVNFDLLNERRKLKDYFAFNPCQEVSGYWVDEMWNVRGMNSKLFADLNWAIRTGGNGVVWERRFIAFVGKFNVKSESDGQKLDNWIKNNLDTWVIISKRHYSDQFRPEKETFSLKKGELDYHEFSSKNEAIKWLRKNDSYFRS